MEIPQERKRVYLEEEKRWHNLFTIFLMMLKVPIFNPKMIGMITKTARNTFLDKVVSKFSSRRYKFKDCSTTTDKDLPIAFNLRREFEE